MGLTRLLLGGARPLASTPLEGDLPLYQVLVEGVSGGNLVLLGELGTAQVSKVLLRMLPDVSTAEGSIDLDDPDLDLFSEDVSGEGSRPAGFYPWLTIRRDGLVIFRGYVGDSAWTIRPGEGRVYFRATGLEGLFARNTAGDAERVNWWDAETNPIGTSGTATYTTATTGGVEGDCLIVSGGASGGYISKVIDLPLSASTQVWHPSVYMERESGSADMPFPLQCVRILDGGPATAADTFTSEVDEDDLTTTDEPVFYRGEPVPITGGSATSTAQISMRLFVRPNQTLIYSNPRLSRNDNESVAPGGDAAQFVSTILAAAIAKCGLTASRSVNLTGNEFPDGLRVEHYQHREFLPALRDVVPSLCEAVYQPWLDRWKVARRVGKRRTELVVGTSWTEVDEIAVDHSRVANVCGVMGDDHGDPINREEAVAVDDTATVTVESWRQAPEGTKPSALAELAAGDLAAKRAPAVSIDGALPIPPGGRSSGDWLNLGLWVGDTIPARVVAGPWDWYSDQRVTGIDLDLGQTETLKVQTADDSEVLP